ncbi:MAG: hypothetical protein K8R90_04465 [Candidatus Cloacimonetes bacterium]|nr:hypothetical protein [Candidatus Cloacimonadota bacterium]
MNIFGWVVLTAATIVGSQWFLLKRYGRNWFLTLPGLFLLYHIVFNVIGGVYVVNGLGPAEVKYLSALLLGVVVHTLAPVIADTILHRNLRYELDNFLVAPMSGLNDTTGFRVSFMLLAGASIAISVYYLSLLPSIPFFDMFKTSVAHSLAISRDLATSSFAGKYHRFSFYFRNILPTLALMTFAARMNWKNQFWNIAFLLTFVFTAFMHVNDVQKMPLINFLGMTLLAYFIFKGRFEWKKVLWLTIIVIVILVVMYQFIMGMFGQEIGKIILTICERLFLAQTKGMYTAFRIYPERFDYLLGATIPNPAGIFPYKRFFLGYQVFAYTFGVKEVVGTAPTVYYTEFYCNFGYGAMIASMFLVSTLLQLFQLFLLRLPKNPLTIGFMAYWLLNASHVSISSIFEYFGIMFAVYWLHFGMMKLCKDIVDTDLKV